MASNSRHFARLLFNQVCQLELAAMRSTGAAHMQSATTAALQRSIKTAPSAASAFPQSAGIPLPTLGNTGVKFNSSRWAGPMAEENISIFDTAAAFNTLKNGADASTLRAVHPAALAHAQRIARAQQMSATIGGFRLLPDLTPGRAIMWGTILAVWAVGASSLLVARSCDIHSFSEVGSKMRLHMAPYRVWLQGKMAAVHDTMHMAEKPVALQQLKAFGGNVHQRMGRKHAESASESSEMSLH